MKSVLRALVGAVFAVVMLGAGAARAQLSAAARFFMLRLPTAYVALGGLCLLAMAAAPCVGQTFTDTPTATVTATVTPTSCRGDLPVVETVTSPTNQLQQVVHFCGRIVAGSSMSACGEAGCAADISTVSMANCQFPCPNSGNASCNKGTVPLLAGQTNHVTVCQNNASCGGGGCVAVDGNGDPLVIVQVFTPTETPTPLASDTPTGTPTATPTPAVAQCAPAPVPSCSAAARSKIMIKKTGIPSHNRVLWKWQRGTALKNDFGDPTAETSYALCVYDDGSLVMQSAFADPNGWADLSRGFKYKNASTNPAGISKVLLQAGAGNAKILVKGAGAALAVPPLPLSDTVAVTVQFVENPGSGNRCWGSVFGAAGAVNTADRFKDKDP